MNHDDLVITTVDFPGMPVGSIGRVKRLPDGRMAVGFGPINAGVVTTVTIYEEKVPILTICESISEDDARVLREKRRGMLYPTDDEQKIMLRALKRKLRQLF